MKMLIVLASAVLVNAVSAHIASQDLRDVEIVTIDTIEEHLRGATTSEPPREVALLMPSASLVVPTTADSPQPAPAVCIVGSERLDEQGAIARNGASLLCAPRVRPEACSASSGHNTMDTGRV